MKNKHFIGKKLWKVFWSIELSKKPDTNKKGWVLLWTHQDSLVRMLNLYSR